MDFNVEFNGSTLRWVELILMLRFMLGAAGNDGKENDSSELEAEAISMRPAIRKSTSTEDGR